MAQGEQVLERTEEPSTPRSSNRWKLTLPELLALSAVVLPVFVALRLSTSAIDLAYHIRAGDIMIETRSLLRIDPFTFTAFGRPWLDQQWGSQILFAALFRLGGWDLLFFTRALLVGLIFFLVYSSARASGASMRLAAWLTIASAVVSLDLPLRPQLFGMVFLSLTVWLVAVRARHPGWIWAIPLIVAAWANLHGSFFLVVLPLFVAWLDDRRRGVPKANRIILVGLTALVAANLNPFGVRIWGYVVGLSTNSEISRLVTEWQPPTLRSVDGVLFFASVGAVAGILIFGKRQASWPPVLGLGILFLVGLIAVRNIFWWALVAPAFLSSAVSERSQIAPMETRSTAGGVDDEPRRWTFTLTALVLAALVIGFLPWWRSTFLSNASDAFIGDGLLSHAPHRVSDRLDSLMSPGQRIFATQMWGSWFEFALPQDRVFVDSRIEIFPRHVWDDYFLVSNGGVGWERVLDRWRASVVVASRTQQARLIPLIREDPGWTQVYQDGDAVVFVRASAGTS